MKKVSVFVSVLLAVSLVSMTMAVKSTHADPKILWMVYAEDTGQRRWVYEPPPGPAVADRVAPMIPPGWVRQGKIHVEWFWGKDPDPCDYCNLYASTQPNALQTGGVVAYGVTHYRYDDCDASGCYWWYKNERWYNVNKTYYFQVKCRNCYIAPWLDSRNEVSEYLPY
ncbi:MAG: hypothetical protein ACE5OR_10600 [bacterium]